MYYENSIINKYLTILQGYIFFINFCPPRLDLFDQKYNNIIKIWNNIFYFNIF